MQTITWQEFYKSYLILKVCNRSYRLGQHFMNMFIYYCSERTCDEVCKGLWEKTGEPAFEQCMEVINKYQWDTQNLPMIERSKRCK